LRLLYENPVTNVLLTVRTHGPYYTNSGYLLCAGAYGPFSYTMVNYRATD